jgi:DNA-binding CsgD family transcriptional regulator
MAGTPLDLSPRERELILAVARGHSIRRSLSALYRKVGVRNQRGLVAWGLELAARGNGHRSLAGDR